MQMKYLGTDSNDFLNGFFRENGIWVSDGAQDIATKFSEEEQEALYALEDTSWWFRYRSGVISHFAGKYLSEKQLILDVGGGNGYTTMRMQEKGYNMALLEPAYAACKNARKRGIHTVICGTVNHKNVKDGSVPQIFLLDVLEHIEDDVGFLELLRQKLVPGGKILLTVPAFRILWSSEDEAAGHFRRYSLRQVEESAVKAGFTVAYASYFFGFLFLPVLFVRVGLEKIGILKRSEKRTAEEKKEIGRKQFQERRGLVRAILSILERRELCKLLKNKRVFFGSSVLCILENDRSCERRP